MKRVVLLAMMFVLVFSVVGCSGSGTDKTKKANKSTEKVYTSSDGEVKLHVKTSKKNEKKVKVEWMQDEGTDWGSNGFVKYTGTFEKNNEVTIGWYKIKEPCVPDQIKITLNIHKDGVTFDYKWEHK